MNESFNQIGTSQTDEEVRTEAKEWASSLKDNEPNVIMDSSNLGGEPLEFTK